MMLTKEQIEDFRKWAMRHPEFNSDRAIAFGALYYMALRAEPEPVAAGLVELVRDAARFRKVAACDWISLRIGEQEFVGISDLAVWADAAMKASK